MNFFVVVILLRWVVCVVVVVFGSFGCVGVSVAFGLLGSSREELSLALGCQVCRGSEA